jgi:hypothetical protein
MLKAQFVCGFHDISHEKYAGASGKHRPDEQAVDTTNGAGPHNIQMFVLAPDGTVLHCLPGYWNPKDLAEELVLAQQLYKVWINKEMSLEDKRQMFSQMQIAHLQQHSKAEKNRSHLQGFDVQFEAQKRLNQTDVFYNPRIPNPDKVPQNVKTADVIMHERIAMRPFVPYDKFDTADYSAYGKNMYDKHEQFRDPTTGQIAQGANLKSEPFIGNDPRAHPVETQVKKQAPRLMSSLLRYGLRAAMSR